MCRAGALESDARIKEDSLQRFFSTFPAGAPGQGLLLLRMVAGAAAAIQGGALVAETAEAAGWAWAVGGLALAGGIALIVGVGTPAAAGAITFSTLLITSGLVPSSPGALVADEMAAVLLVADAAALALLGPGAHSIDAHLFGRREIIIRPDPPAD